jgi:hypothetical protein
LTSTQLDPWGPPAGRGSTDQDNVEDLQAIVDHQRKNLYTNDERNTAGYLHRLRRILLYQSMGCVRPLEKSHEQRDRTGHYEQDGYEYV